MEICLTHSNKNILSSCTTKDRSENFATMLKKSLNDEKSKIKVIQNFPGGNWKSTSIYSNIPFVLRSVKKCPKLISKLGAFLILDIHSRISISSLRVNAEKIYGLFQSIQTTNGDFTAMKNMYIHFVDYYWLAPSGAAKPSPFFAVRHAPPFCSCHASVTGQTLGFYIY